MSETFPQEFGRYQLLERLAMGGMAELFLAEVAGAHGFAKTVVIKRILPHLAADEKFTEMFIAEAKLTAQLAHPKIAQTLELGNEDKQLFIVMEYIDGFDVLALLRECAHRRVRVPREISVYIVKEVLDALDFAHKLGAQGGDLLGIVHRDVSPSNILLSKRGDVKLVDFGIAHAVAEEDETKSGTLKGKYGYMSPEQVLGQDVSPRSDIFAAGIVLAEMLMGRRLFAAANELDVLLMVRDVDLGRLVRFGEHIDEDLSSILRWALRKDPGDRYNDAAAFRDALDEWLFEKRHRIGTGQLAEIVKTLYDDALSRRKDGISAMVEQAGVALGSSSGKPSSATHSLSVSVSATGPTGAQGTPVSDVATVGREVSGSIAAVGELEGIPTGMGSRSTSEQDARSVEGEASSVIEISLSDEVEVELRAEPSSSEAQTAGSSQSQVDDILDLDLGDDSNSPMPVDLVQSSIAEIELDLSGSSGLELARDLDVENVSVHSDEEEIAVASGSIDMEAIDEEEEEDEIVSFGTVSASESKPSDLDLSDVDLGHSDVSARSGRRAKSQISDAKNLSKSEPPTPPRLDPGSDVADESGDLEQSAALAILYNMTAERRTGKLVLSFGGVRKEIYFKRGVPEYVSSNIASELMGAYLVRMEVISSGELDMALAVMPHFGGKLGDTLVGLGLMKPLEVFRHLTKQVRSKIIEVCTWTQGQYEWYSDAECPRQAFPLDLDPLEVYGAGATDMPREAIETWCERHANFSPIAAGSSVVVPELFQVAGIRRLQRSLDGSRTIEDITREADAGPRGLDQLRLLFLLVNTKLVIAHDSP